MTGQIYEKLIIEGKQFAMATCPPIPELEGQIIKTQERKPLGDIVWTTACWRNYVGTWEIS